MIPVAVKSAVKPPREHAAQVEISEVAKEKWSRRSGLNGRPADYESAAPTPRDFASTRNSPKNGRFRDIFPARVLAKPH
jgi:hypothetical protein